MAGHRSIKHVEDIVMRPLSEKGRENYDRIFGGKEKKNTDDKKK